LFPFLFSFRYPLQTIWTPDHSIFFKTPTSSCIAAIDNNYKPFGTIYPASVVFALRTNPSTWSGRLVNHYLLNACHDTTLSVQGVPSKKHKLRCASSSVG
jgi:hypothetical protein